MIYLAIPVLAILVLAVLLVIKTAMLKPTPAKTAKVTLDNSPRAAAYGKALSRMVQQETISSRNQQDRSKFDAFHGVLEELFPNVHANCEKHVSTAVCCSNGRAKARANQFS